MEDVLAQMNRRRVLGGALFACLAHANLASAAVLHSSVSLMDMIHHPLLKTYYSGVPRRKVGPDGRGGFNYTGVHAPLIEEQRNGTEWILHGIISGNRSFMELGWKALDFGRGWQEPDGGFGRYGYWHSNSGYLEGLARALVLDPAARTPERLDSLRRGLGWMRDPVNAAKGMQQNASYTHREYVIAAMYGQGAMVLKDSGLAQEAVNFAKAGLARQRVDGINPEMGGFDANYQMVGVLFALRYYPTAPKDILRNLRQMIKKAIGAELLRQELDGSFLMKGSTRVGHEAVGGVIKQPNYPEIFEALCYADYVMPNASWRRAAIAAAKFNGIPFSDKIQNNK